ncbi:unnamed protein product [Enterobius vermicularis]|uniref:Glycosyltransferase family 92 protein n=1 Tax=Enterobius vermicularis TaxID=51028 RepID=A0A0N4UZ88_ENTVE|nr:unnamed protein product [Enterobius vermicularis]
MGRASFTSSIWHSRIRLFAFSVIFFLLTLLLDLISDQDPGDNYPEQNAETSFNEDFDYALEALNYMYDLQNGKAEILPVVEQLLLIDILTLKPKRVNVIWRCGLKWPTHFLNEGWLSVNDFHIFSATIDDNLSVVVEATVREIWQRAWDPRSFFYIPNLISCPLPEYFVEKEHLAVSVVNSACRGSDEAIRVRRTKPPKNGKKIWLFQIEMNRLVVRKLKVPLTLPGNSPNNPFTRSHFIWRNRQQKRRHELIPYNDCLYRHIDTHNYILIVDTDELVVPLQSNNWSELLRVTIGNETKHPVTSISVRNVFKFVTNSSDSNVPEYMFMLRNRRMSKLLSKPNEYGKSFTSTDTVATVFNHFALHRQYGNVSRTIHAHPDVALKLHYKITCPIESRKQCFLYQNETVDDKSLDRFADDLITRVTRVLNLLKLK